MGYNKKSAFKDLEKDLIRLGSRYKVLRTDIRPVIDSLRDEFTMSRQASNPTYSDLDTEVRIPITKAQYETVKEMFSVYDPKPRGDWTLRKTYLEAEGSVFEWLLEHSMEHEEHETFGYHAEWGEDYDYGGMPRKNIERAVRRKWESLSNKMMKALERAPLSRRKADEVVSKYTTFDSFNDLVAEIAKGHWKPTLRARGRDDLKRLQAMLDQLGVPYESR